MANQDQLFELLHDELHRLAQSAMRKERPNHTLQPTALINEAYLRLRGDASWPDRAAFLGIAARAMRQVLIDHARLWGAQKRKGEKVELQETDAVCDLHIEEVLAVDEALREFAELDERAAQVVELRYFAGMNEEEIASALAISTKTVKRDWQFARAWLERRLAVRETGEQPCL